MNVSRILVEHIDNFKIKNGATDGAAAAEKHVKPFFSEAEPTRDEIITAIGKMNESVEESNSKEKEQIRFSYHEETNRIIMRVTNSETNEIIREIPSKNALKFLEYLQEYAGIFVDESR